jgi:glycerol-3-phosphate O-acyltransferase/dihydroxyacetone phosphate acyltransferase
MSVAALSQYTTPITPKESPWIQRSGSPSQEPAPSVVPSTVAKKSDVKKKRRTPPSRKLIRHVLRARAEAVRALVSFFAQLEKGPSEERRVISSEHLAKLYGGNDDGRRNSREVISFLRKRGASVAGLEDTISVEGEWAADALSTEWEGESSDVGRDDDLVWVPPGSTSGKD